MTSPLEIRLLGTPTITFQERPLKFRSRKVLALLIYLVVTRERHNRQSLMALLWPESDPKRASASLRSTVVRLRKALVDAGEFVVTGPGVVYFDVERPHTLDLHLLETAVLPDATPNASQAALAAIRGEFLEGFSLPDAPGFDDWTTVQREVWQRRLETIYERLTRHLLATGEAREAQRFAGEWLARSPLNETAYTTLMEAHFLNGDRTAALQAYDRCAQMLHAELGLKPAAATIALAKRIRHAEHRRARDDVIPAFLLTQPAALQELPLVGRASEHAQLAALYQQAGLGKTQVAAVIGEAGIGKTRLVQAFVAWASLADSAADVLHGRAFEVGGRLPFQPLVDALRVRLEAENAPEDLLADVWLAELSQLLPELRDRYPDLPQPLTGDPDFVRSRIFEAAARLLIALAARRPVILFVDDLQWADAGTLDMLHYLARRCTQDETPILLLLMARQEDMARLHDWFSGLDRESSLTQISLTVLPVTAVQKLVSILAGNGTGQEMAVQSFGGWLQAETGGVPFFMEAVLQMLVEQGFLPRQQQHGRDYFDVSAVWQQIQRTERLPVPPRVRDVILSRLRRLSEPAQSLLLAGAVMGRECSFEWLCQVSGVAEEEGVAALAELLKGRLLLEISREARPYRFAHDNIRQVIYKEAGEARRRLAHRRALAVLQQTEVPAAELAYHAIAVRQDDLAFRYSLAAGDAALAAHVVAEAITHYENARQLLHDKKAGEVDKVTVRHLYLQLGRSLELLNRFEQAVQLYREMASLADERSDEALRLASLVAEGTITALPYDVQDLDRARIVSGEALALAIQLGDKTAEAKTLWNKLLIERVSGVDTALTIGYGERAAELARETQERDLLATILNDLASVYAAAGELDSAETTLLEAEKILRQLNDPSMLGNTYNFLGMLTRERGQYDRAVAYFREGKVVTKPLGGIRNFPFMTLNLGMVLLLQGNFSDAHTELKNLLSLEETYSYHFLFLTTCQLMAQISLLLGAHEQGIRWCRKAISVNDQVPAFARPPTFAFLARLLLRQGDLPQARAALADSMTWYDPQFTMPGAWSYRTVPQAQVEIGLALGEIVKAETAANEMLVILEKLKYQGHMAEAWLMRALVDLARNRTEAAYAALQKGRELAVVIGERPVSWRILWELSRLESAAGRHNEAERYRQQSKEVVTYIADHAGSADLRTSFLALPEVEQVLSED